MHFNIMQHVEGISLSVLSIQSRHTCMLHTWYLTSKSQQEKLLMMNDWQKHPGRGPIGLIADMSLVFGGGVGMVQIYKTSE